MTGVGDGRFDATAKAGAKSPDIRKDALPAIARGLRLDPGLRRVGWVWLALLVTACGGGRVERPHRLDDRPVPVRRPVAATPMAPVAAATAPGSATALTAGVVAGPPVSSLPIGDRDAAAALAAFRGSCPSLQRRTDTSGLTRAADWQRLCAAASATDPRDARSFFVDQFEAVQVGDGRAFATGYYEPEIAGSRDRRPGYDVPVYARPDDLVDVDLGLFSDALKGKKNPRARERPQLRAV